MKLLTTDQLAEQLSRHPRWLQKNDHITQVFRFDNFMQAMGFVNQVALLAEKAEHHPDILIQYSHVTLTLTTHSQAGITDNDFHLATQIDRLIA